MTLEDLKLEFNQWRKNKSSRGNSIPDDLWKKVSKISDTYSSSAICKALSISGLQFKKHSQRLSDMQNKPKETKFIELPLANPNCTLEIQTQDKTLSLKLPVEQLQSLIPSIIQSL